MRTRVKAPPLLLWPPLYSWLCSLMAVAAARTPRPRVTMVRRLPSFWLRPRCVLLWWARMAEEKLLTAMATCRLRLVSVCVRRNRGGESQDAGERDGNGGGAQLGLWDCQG